jgi:hypothetical protein
VRRLRGRGGFADLAQTGYQGLHLFRRQVIDVAEIGDDALLDFAALAVVSISFR